MSDTPNADTFERSLEHWSEANRQGMEHFYALATADYRHLAEALDWKTWLENCQRTAPGRSLRLLDVACGSGKFPNALVQHADVGAAAIEPVAYSLLDPSAFSISEARAALRPPFQPDQEFEVTLQDLRAPDDAFDIVWATHALYAVPPAQIDAALEQFARVLNGIGFIAHACSDGHYLRFYDLFLTARGDTQSQPYTSAEDITAALDRLGIAFDARPITYANGAPSQAREQIEGFLQRCVFSDSLSLDAMLADPVLGPYLEGCQGDAGWRFDQRVMLIFIRP